MVAVATAEAVAAEAWAVGEGDDGCADAVDLGASIFSLLNPAQPGQTDEPCTMQLTREQRSQPSVPRREHLREQETWISHLPPSVARPMYAFVAAPPCPPAAPAHAAGRGVPCACSGASTTAPTAPAVPTRAAANSSAARTTPSQAVAVSSQCASRAVAAEMPTATFSNNPSLSVAPVPRQIHSNSCVCLSALGQSKWPAVASLVTSSAMSLDRYA